ncbi:Rho GTPase-activating protein syd-1 [Dirofilaria immitis]|nr:Rho GTPase-activating protein syd-1 [Dirofilaria immitis]
MAWQKARQQQEMAKRCSQPSSASTSSATVTGLSSMMTLSPRQHFTGHSSRLLNSQAEKLEETVSRTARVPPPKLLPSAVRRTDSFTTTAQLPSSIQMLPSAYTYSMPRSLTQRPVPMQSFPGPSTAPDYLPASSSYGAFPGSLGLSQFHVPSGTSRPLPINQRSLSDVAGYSMHHSLCSPPGAMDPRYMLRGQSAWHPTDPSSRSNSLPRRRAISGTAPPRTVKWRNDVIDGANARMRFGSSNVSGQYGRTIDDIFSRKNIVIGHVSIRELDHRKGNQDGHIHTVKNLADRFSLGHERGDLLDRLHVSPLMNRRVPLRVAGPGFDVDTPLDVTSLTGILVVQMYCVLEVNETHRARTGVSTAEQKFRWRETFEIDVQHATHANFSSIHGIHNIVDRLNGNRMFALNLEPKGQLIVKIAFHSIAVAFRRTVNSRYDGLFGIPLQRLVAREGRETPLILSRLLQEIEHRGVDYSVCGSLEKKRILREELELNVERARLNVEAVPDTNVLACLVKDFYVNYRNPFSVALPNDPQGNRRLLLRVIDCLPVPNKNTLIQIMDHLKMVISSEQHNGITTARLAGIFGCLLFVPDSSGIYQSKIIVNPLDTDQATRTFRLLIDIWPSRVNGSESSGSGSASSSTDVTNIINPVSESQC